MIISILEWLNKKGTYGNLHEKYYEQDYSVQSNIAILLQGSDLYLHNYTKHHNQNFLL